MQRRIYWYVIIIIIVIIVVYSHPVVGLAVSSTLSHQRLSSTIRTASLIFSPVHCTISSINQSIHPSIFKVA